MKVLHFADSPHAASRVAEQIRQSAPHIEIETVVSLPEALARLEETSDDPDHFAVVVLQGLCSSSELGEIVQQLCDDRGRQPPIVVLSSAVEGAPGGHGAVTAAVKDDAVTHAGELVALARTFELAQANATLSHSVRQLQELMSTSPAVLYRLVKRDGGFIPTWVSPNIEEIFGYTVPEAMLPDWWTSHVHPDYLERIPASEALLLERGRLSHEYQFYDGNGDLRWIHDEQRLLRNPSGTFEVVGSWNDMTEEMRLKESRVTLEGELRLAQKMEALGTLAGGMAHELNNSLATIIGNLELARQDVAADAPVVESLVEIGKASQRAKLLVQRVLAFSRPMQPARSVIRLRPLIEETMQLMRSTLPADLELVTSFDDSRPEVLGDPTQLDQVLVNLCSNAWQAMEGRPGQIDVRLTTAHTDDITSAWLKLPPGHYAHMKVRDNGRGMDAGTRERVFEPFFTTKSVGQGTGLGLSVVHAIVRAHDGVILVESELGVGTTFDIYLPTTDAAAVVGAIGSTGDLEKDDRG